MTTSFDRNRLRVTTEIIVQPFTGAIEVVVRFRRAHDGRRVTLRLTEFSAILSVVGFDVRRTVFENNMYAVRRACLTNSFLL